MAMFLEEAVDSSNFKREVRRGSKKDLFKNPEHALPENDEKKTVRRRYTGQQLPFESKTRIYHGRFEKARRTAGRLGGKDTGKTGRRRVGSRSSEQSLLPCIGSRKTSWACLSKHKLLTSVLCAPSSDLELLWDFCNVFCPCNHCSLCTLTLALDLSLRNLSATG